jgi:hypothetical protein
MREMIEFLAQVSIFLFALVALWLIGEFFFRLMDLLAAVLLRPVDHFVYKTGPHGYHQLISLPFATSVSAALLSLGMTKIDTSFSTPKAASIVDFYVVCGIFALGALFAIGIPIALMSQLERIGTLGLPARMHEMTKGGAGPADRRSLLQSIEDEQCRADRKLRRNQRIRRWRLGASVLTVVAVLLSWGLLGAHPDKLLRQLLPWLILIGIDALGGWALPKYLHHVVSSTYESYREDLKQAAVLDQVRGPGQFELPANATGGGAVAAGLLGGLVGGAVGGVLSQAFGLRRLGKSPR